MSKKILVHHRALNTKENFVKYLEETKNKNDSYIYAAEGDLCWVYIDNKPLIYIYHPDLSGNPLSNDEISSLYEKGLLFTLEDLFKIDSQTHFILELKSGLGDTKKAFEQINSLIKKYDVKNFIVDAFYLKYLKILKEVNPNIRTSLHTKFIFNKYVLETTYQKPYVNIHNIYNLKCVDIFTLSYSTSLINLLNLNIDKYLVHVYKANKQINFGSVKNTKTFNKVMKSQVSHIYLRSKSLLNSLGFNI